LADAARIDVCNGWKADVGGRLGRQPGKDQVGLVVWHTVDLRREH
jgi:hypothetical protein